MRAVPSRLRDLRGCVSPSPLTPRLVGAPAGGPGLCRAPVVWGVTSGQGGGAQGQVGKTKFRGWVDGGDGQTAP